MNVLYELFILVCLGISYVYHLIVKIVFYPMRFYCKSKGHRWYTTGGSWIFDTGDNWGCTRCKMTCAGDFDTLEKHGWTQETKTRLK